MTCKMGVKVQDPRAVSPQRFAIERREMTQPVCFCERPFDVILLAGWFWTIGRADAADRRLSPRARVRERGREGGLLAVSFPKCARYGITLG